MRGQEFADWLDRTLQERGWTGADLQRASRRSPMERGLDPGLISRYRKPGPDWTQPSTENCRRIAAALHVDPDDVLVLAGHRAPPPISEEELIEDPLFQEVQAALPELREALEGIPEVWRRTVVRNTIRRNVDELRDYGKLISLSEARQAAAISKRPPRRVSKPEATSNTADPPTKGPLVSSERSPRLLLAAS